MVMLFEIRCISIKKRENKLDAYNSIWINSALSWIRLSLGLKTMVLGPLGLSGLHPVHFQHFIQWRTSLNSKKKKPWSSTSTRAVAGSAASRSTEMWNFIRRRKPNSHIKYLLKPFVNHRHFRTRAVDRQNSSPTGLYGFDHLKSPKGFQRFVDDAIER